MGAERFDLESIASRTLTEEIVRKYRDGLAKVENRAELMEHLRFWRPLASKAYGHGVALAERDVRKFVKALRRDKADKGPMTDPAFLEIAMPSLLLVVTGMAHQYSVPFGAAFRRMVDLGMILVEDGVATLVE